MTATVQHWKNPTKISVTEPVGRVRNYRLLADFAMPEVTDAEALANAQLFAEVYNERPNTNALRMALVELVRQVEMSGAVDDHGHYLSMLQALEDARSALAGTPPEPTADEVERGAKAAWSESATRVRSGARLRLADEGVSSS